MLKMTHNKIKLIYWLCVSILTIAFIFDVLYTSKYIQQSENDTLERWGIIITLGGIFASLKYLHPQLNETEKEDKISILKKYYVKYFVRLGTLTSISIFNLICLNITGIENFKYLSFISIFALFFCAPSKAHIENETDTSESI